MKKIYLLIGCFIVIIIFVILFSTQWSYSANLKRYGFNKNNIITEEIYSMDYKHLTKVLLLANTDKLAIIGLTDYGFGVWKDANIESIVENPSLGEFATTAFVISKSRGINGYYEKHVFVASFIQSKNLPQISGNSDFYLNVDYFTINDKVLLFAHGIAGRNMNEIGSTDVISYLKEKIDFN